MATPEGQKVTFPSENPAGDVPGFLVGPLPANKAGVIVIHEWWGMNDQIQQYGRKIAQEGDLMVLVMDLYRGKVADDRETAGHYMSGLDWQGAVKDIAAGSKFLKSQGCGKVGAIGFCMGGALSFAGAGLCPEDISAAAPFYGIPGDQLVDLTKLKVPVQAHFGEDDTIEGFSSKKDYTALKAKLQAAAVKNFELYEYPGCGHAFCNPLNKVGPTYNPQAEKQALERVYVFFKKYLSG